MDGISETADRAGAGSLPPPDVSELEKSYFFRFMTFISNEHVLSKFGNNTKECSGFASTWHASLLEKRLAGNIFDDLVLVSPDGNGDGEKITAVDLKYSRGCGQ